ncbi:Uncharacterised protein [Streptococcus pneumoniae]|nr:Uncharacterised protein [Streptococcus pneumoniae]
MLGDCVMLVNEMEITDHRVDNLFEKGKNEIKDSIGTNSVLNKKIIRLVRNLVHFIIDDGTN